MKIFVSHSLDAVRKAVRFKELVLSGNPFAKVFLSSDWESIPAGANWLEAIENALGECDYFVALITKEDDAKRLWVNYETGFVRSRHLLPKLIVFSGVDPKKIDNPLAGIQFLMHGDTSRWLLEFSLIGLTVSKELEAQFAALFEHR
jgi:hypothetical protein